MHDTDSASELRARVRELESEMAELRDVVTETATDNNGREWTIFDLMSQFGLTRRKAIVVFGLLASGMPLVHALTRTAAAGTDSEGEVGTAAKPADAWLEDVYDKNDNAVMEFPGDGSVSIETATIGGQKDDDGFEQIESFTDGTAGTWSFDVTDLKGYDGLTSVLKIRIAAHNNNTLTADFFDGGATFDWTNADGTTGSGSVIDLFDPAGGSNSYLAEFVVYDPGYFAMVGDVVGVDSGGGVETAAETIRSPSGGISSIDFVGENNFSSSFVQIEVLGRDSSNW